VPLVASSFAEPAQEEFFAWLAAIFVALPAMLAEAYV
jgi:hypothetical protein